MTSMLDLITARAALDGGRREEARKLLMGVVRDDMGNGEAWHLLSLAVDDPAQKADCERRAAAAGYQAPGAPASPPAPEQPAAPPSPSPSPAATGPTVVFKQMEQPPPVQPPSAVPSAVELWPCARCGELNPRHAQFCARCGLNFAEPLAPTPIMQQPVIYPPQAYPQPLPVMMVQPQKERSNAGIIIGALVLIIVVMCGIGAAMSPGSTKFSPEEEAHLACMGAVQARLKAPSTADISSFGESSVLADRAQAGVWMIAGHVDAENAFGARIRQSWLCRVKQTDNNYSVQDLSFTE